LARQQTRISTIEEYVDKDLKEFIIETVESTMRKSLGFYLRGAASRTRATNKRARTRAHTWPESHSYSSRRMPTANFFPRSQPTHLPPRHHPPGPPHLGLKG
jgi:hypothetical protein